MVAACCELLGGKCLRWPAAHAPPFLGESMLSVNCRTAPSKLPIDMNDIELASGEGGDYKCECNVITNPHYMLSSGISAHYVYS